MFNKFYAWIRICFKTGLDISFKILGLLNGQGKLQIRDQTTQRNTSQPLYKTIAGAQSKNWQLNHLVVAKQKYIDYIEK